MIKKNLYKSISYFDDDKELERAFRTLEDKKIVEYLTGEKKNLADFIRVFGARLEDNYSSWRSFFERKVTEELIESESN